MQIRVSQIYFDHTLRFIFMQIGRSHYLHVDEYDHVWIYQKPLGYY